jgi:hypothetical protein
MQVSLPYSHQLIDYQAATSGNDIAINMSMDVGRIL